ncbi:MAG: hypothetical protein Kow0098_09530 [Ignavibacteriaceae bacterium]
MKRLFSNLNLNKKLALIAIFLGLISLFGSSPYDSSLVTVDIKELSMESVKNSDLIVSAELADKIIKGEIDYRLIDLQDEKSFSDYHIPGAVNVKLPDLHSPEFLRNEKIILCSDDDLKSAQAWFILKARGYKAVYILKGGLKAWKDEILFPEINSEKIKTSEGKKLVEISKYFGGIPQTGETQNKQNKLKQMPKLQTPANTIPVNIPKKKKKEGC